jgi:hypothetical protein
MPGKSHFKKKVPVDCAHIPNMKAHLDIDILLPFQEEEISESILCPHLQSEDKAPKGQWLI